MITVTESLDRTLAAQHGVASDAQVRSQLSWRHQQHLVAAGVWRRVAPRVVGVAGAPLTWHRRAWVAVLAAGPDAALSHGSAGRLYRMDGYDHYDELHLTLGRGAHASRTEATHHVWRGHTAAEIHRVAGLPVVRMPVVLCGLAALDGRDAAARALDSALRQGRSPRWFVQEAQRWQGRGRSGPSTVLELVAERTAQRLPRSWFQRLAHRELAEVGITLVHEHPLYAANGRKLAELDLADTEHRVGIECQSWEWHATPGAQRADARRKRAVRRAGWEIVDVWWSDLRRMDDVVATLRTIRTERNAR